MRYQVVTLDYGCEIKPTLEYLKCRYPLDFIVEQLTIYVSVVYDTRELDDIRLMAASFRDGIQAGYRIGFNDKSPRG